LQNRVNRFSTRHRIGNFSRDHAAITHRIRQPHAQLIGDQADRRMLIRLELLVRAAFDDVGPLAPPFGPPTVAARDLVEVVRDEGQVAMRVRPLRQLVDDLALTERPVGEVLVGQPDLASA